MVHNPQPLIRMIRMITIMVIVVSVMTPLTVALIKAPSQDILPVVQAYTAWLHPWMKV